MHPSEAVVPWALNPTRQKRLRCVGGLSVWRAGRLAQIPRATVGKISMKSTYRSCVCRPNLAFPF